MDNTRILWGAVGIAGMFCPIIGMVVGLFRYRKNKDKVITEEREKYKKRQEKGGIPSLFLNVMIKEYSSEHMAFRLILGY